MANDKNNINELVSDDDDDPTAELEVLTLAQIRDQKAVESESDLHTFNARDNDGVVEDLDIAVSELESDLEARSKTIGRLQFDIEQLRTKWIGLETEIKAREEQTRILSRELHTVTRKLSKKEALLAKRDQTIEKLEAEILGRDEEIQSMQAAHKEVEQQIANNSVASAALQDDLASANVSVEALNAEVGNLRIAEQRAIEREQQLQQELADQQQALTKSQQTVAELENYIDGRRTRWDGQQAEIERLQTDLKQWQTDLSAARSQVDARDRSISELQRDYESLQREIKDSDDAEIASLRRLVSEQTGQIASNTALITELRTRLEKGEAYADSLRQQLQDRIEESAHFKNRQDAIQEAFDRATGEIEEFQHELAEQHQANTDLRQELQNRIAEFATLESSHVTMRQALDDATAATAELRQELAEQEQASAALQEQLDAIEQRHEEELRKVRFELSEAQESVAQHELINEQLTSDLIDSRGFRDRLESMLSQGDEKHRHEIESFEKQIRKLTGQIEDYEQKLATKSEAVNCLLTELAKKTEQVESIGQIEKVIHEIDNRISQRIDERPGGDRITRVLIGNIDGQVLQFPLFKNRLTIGRTPQNDIQLTGSYISRRHALVVTEGDTATIVDWGSKNGIFVNSSKVSEHVLRSGDIVSIGTAMFRYEERPKRDS